MPQHRLQRVHAAAFEQEVVGKGVAEVMAVGGLHAGVLGSQLGKSVVYLPGADEDIFSVAEEMLFGVAWVLRFMPNAA